MHIGIAKGLTDGVDADVVARSQEVLVTDTALTGRNHLCPGGIGVGGEKLLWGQLVFGETIFGGRCGVGLVLDRVRDFVFTERLCGLNGVVVIKWW